MLVISRRIGESFLIGDDIEATVVDITGEKVILGITAPKSVAIARLDDISDKSSLSGINKKGDVRQYGEKASPPNDKAKKQD